MRSLWNVHPNWCFSLFPGNKTTPNFIEYIALRCDQITKSESIECERKCIHCMEDCMIGIFTHPPLCFFSLLALRDGNLKTNFQLCVEGSRVSITWNSHDHIEEIPGNQLPVHSPPKCYMRPN
jgi:hypothetical protein